MFKNKDHNNIVDMSTVYSTVHIPIVYLYTILCNFISTILDEVSFIIEIN